MKNIITHRINIYYRVKLIEITLYTDKTMELTTLTTSSYLTMSEIGDLNYVGILTPEIPRTVLIIVVELTPPTPLPITPLLVARSSPPLLSVRNLTC